MLTIYKKTGRNTIIGAIKNTDMLPTEYDNGSILYVMTPTHADETTGEIIPGYVTRKIYEAVSGEWIDLPFSAGATYEIGTDDLV